MNIPTREECLELLNEYKVHESIQRHSKAVAKVAVFLAKKLKEKGVDINVELVEAAGLLHDLLKAVSFTHFEGLSEAELKKTHELQSKYSETGHAEAAYLELKNTYPEVAKIVRIHTPKNMLDTQTWEEKLVNYSDKRVWHDKIAALKDREKHYKERYNYTMPEEVKAAYAKTEKQIFDIIELEPDKLGEYIE